jgi:MtN3 and saliva related transmembrane protein
MGDFVFWLGIAAAALTSLSYWPQVKKALPRGSTGGLSVRTLVALTSGLACWVLYGLMRGDWTIVVANAVGASLAATVLGCKLRDDRRSLGRERT